MFRYQVFSFCYLIARMYLAEITLQKYGQTKPTFKNSSLKHIFLDHKTEQKFIESQ